MSLPSWKQKSLSCVLLFFVGYFEYFVCMYDFNVQCYEYMANLVFYVILHRAPQ